LLQKRNEPPAIGMHSGAYALFCARRVHSSSLVLTIFDHVDMTLVSF